VPQSLFQFPELIVGGNEQFIVDHSFRNVTQYVYRVTDQSHIIITDSLMKVTIPLKILVIQKYSRCTDSVEENPSGKLLKGLADWLCLIFSLLTSSVHVVAQWNKTLLLKRMVTQLAKKFPYLLWDKKSQYHVNMITPLLPVLRPPNPPHALAFYSFQILSNKSCYLHLDLPCSLFPSAFPTTILYAFIVSPIRYTCPRIDFITLTL
jgi:hypothetical protein